MQEDKNRAQVALLVDSLISIPAITSCNAADIHHSRAPYAAQTSSGRSTLGRGPPALCD
jgi:hypothetical protein